MMPVSYISRMPLESHKTRFVTILKSTMIRSQIDGAISDGILSDLNSMSKWQVRHSVYKMKCLKSDILTCSWNVWSMTFCLSSGMSLARHTVLCQIFCLSSGMSELTSNPAKPHGITRRTAVVVKSPVSCALYIRRIIPKNFLRIARNSVI
jgi:hypothetical protein